MTSSISSSRIYLKLGWDVLSTIDGVIVVRNFSEIGIDDSSLLNSDSLCESSYQASLWADWLLLSFLVRWCLLMFSFLTYLGICVSTTYMLGCIPFGPLKCSTFTNNKKNVISQPLFHVYNYILIIYFLVVSRNKGNVVYCIARLAL